MSDNSHRGDTNSNSMFKGQLKIALSVDNNALQVHVVEAANLRSRWKDLCDPYVQLQVCPDEACNNRHQTTTLCNTNSPYYDSSFSLSLSGVSKQHRLVISAWHRDMQKNCGEFLGCMSFGMKHLIHKVKRKKVEGWYHLLSENVGHRKHLSVDPQSEPSTPSKQHQHELEQTVVRRESFTLVIHKQSTGYGFTVRGSCPAKVGRVKENGPAHLVGLQRGDHIIKINGQNVCRSSAESVASIVRHADQMVVLDLYRSKKSHRVDSSCASSRASSIPSLDLNHAILEQQDENMPPTASILNVSRSVIGASCKDLIDEQKKESRLVESVLDSPYKWDPEMSAIGSMGSSNSVPMLRNYISVPSLSEIEEDSQHMSMTTDDFLNEQLPESLCCNEDSFLVSDSDTSFLYDRSIITENQLPSQPNCSLATESEFVTHCSLEGVRREVLSGGSSAECSVQSNAAPQHQPPCVLTLLRLEQKFSKDIHLAVQHYSRPLRHCLVSPKQHQRLFQNVEKMAAIAGFIAKQLEQESAPSVYTSRVSMLCESYETYLSGLCEAKALLTELQADPEFYQFLTLTAHNCNLELEEAILRPVHHLKNTIFQLQEILLQLVSNSIEASQLSSVIIKLQSTLFSSQKSRSNSRLKGRDSFHVQQQLNISELSSALRTESPMSAMDSDYEEDVSHPGSASMSLANSSVNSEVLELQSRLSIPRDIKRFKLANSHRHLIYSGHLMRVQDGRPQRLLVLLLSDLLLVTRESEERTGHLTVVEEPLLLERMNISWERQNACEFTVTAQGRRCRRQMTLHAESSQQKNAWRSIIEHRMSVSIHSQNTSQILDIL